MKYCAGLVDALFGKRIALHVPGQDGTTQNVNVTERWLSDRERQSKTGPAEGSAVIAHIIDPEALARFVTDAGASVMWFARIWTIGRDLSMQEYQRWRDPETGGLYTYLKREGGSSSIVFVERQRWEALQAMLRLFGGR